MKLISCVLVMTAIAAGPATLPSTLPARPMTSADAKESLSIAEASAIQSIRSSPAWASANTAMQTARSALDDARANLPIKDRLAYSTRFTEAKAVVDKLEKDAVELDASVQAARESLADTTAREASQTQSRQEFRKQIDEYRNKLLLFDEMKTGQIGTMGDVRILQILSPTRALGSWGGGVLMFDGITTRGVADDQVIDMSGRIFEVGETTAYETAFGATNTVFRLRRREDLEAVPPPVSDPPKPESRKPAEPQPQRSRSTDRRNLGY